MHPSLHILTHRLVLALMLLTFLSPSFGWQMVASHELLEHESVAAGLDHHGHHDHDDLDEVPAPHEYKHEDAHSMIGHVLSHMPATPFVAVLPLYVPHQLALEGSEPALVIPMSPPDQPYRPPQALRA